MPSGLTMRGDNNGLTVRINLWSLKRSLDNFNPKKARLWIRGQVTNAETKEARMFNDPGELLTVLGKWNADKFKQLRDKARLSKLKR